MQHLIYTHINSTVVWVPGFVSGHGGADDGDDGVDDEEEKIEKYKGEAWEGWAGAGGGEGQRVSCYARSCG